MAEFDKWTGKSAQWNQKNRFPAVYAENILDLTSELDYKQSKDITDGPACTKTAGRNSRHATLNFLVHATIMLTMS